MNVIAHTLLEGRIKDVNACHFCDSGQIEGGNVDINGRQASQRVWCLACDREWTEVYSFTMRTWQEGED